MINNTTANTLDATNGGFHKSHIGGNGAILDEKKCKQSAEFLKLTYNGIDSFQQAPLGCFYTWPTSSVYYSTKKYVKGYSSWYRGVCREYIPEPPCP